MGAKNGNENSLGDPVDLAQVVVALLERLLVLELALLAWRHLAELLVRLRFPDAHVGIVRTRQHKLGIGRKVDGKDAIGKEQIISSVYWRTSPC